MVRGMARKQFSLRMVFAGLALVAVVAFALSGQSPVEVGIAFCFVTSLIPAVLAAGIVNGGRDTRTFFAGAIACVPFRSSI
jgi:hypothetical protein